MIARMEVRKAYQYDDPRGSLSVIDEDALPFPVRRIYYLHGVPLGAIRAEHGHRQLEQVMICMHGRITVTLTDGFEREAHVLQNPSELLHVPRGIWRSARFELPDSVLCVLASRPYEPDDYIHSFEEFLAWARAERKSADAT